MNSDRANGSVFETCPCPQSLRATAKMECCAISGNGASRFLCERGESHFGFPRGVKRIPEYSGLPLCFQEVPILLKLLTLTIQPSMPAAFLAVTRLKACFVSKLSPKV